MKSHRTGRWTQLKAAQCIQQRSILRVLPCGRILLLMPTQPGVQAPVPNPSAVRRRQSGGGDERERRWTDDYVNASVKAEEIRWDNAGEVRKREIEEEKQAEATKRADVQRKLAFLESAEEKLAQFDTMAADVAKAKSLMLELQARA